MRARALPTLFLVLLSSCSSHVLFRGESPNGLGTVYVVQEGPWRTLRFGHPAAEDQSAYDPARPDYEPFAYIRSALLALAYTSRHERLLMIGLGGASYLRHVHGLAPRMTLEAVELNPLVLEVCRRYFRLPGTVTVYLDDGRRFVERTPQHYDVVFIDAYDAVDYPRHLGTREFFLEVAHVLAPGGVVVANLSPNSDWLRARLVRTFREVFPQGPCLRTPDGNSIVLGWSGASPASTAVQARLALLEASSARRYALALAARERCLIDSVTAPVLLDSELGRSSQLPRLHE